MSTVATGRPAVAGLLLGVFVWLDLVLFGVIAFQSALVYVIPVVGLVVGVLIGGIGRSRLRA